MKKIKHIMHNNLKALNMVRSIVPSLLAVSLLQAVFVIIEPIFTIWYYKYIIDSALAGVPVIEILKMTVVLGTLLVAKLVFSSWYEKVFRPRKALILEERSRKELYQKLIRCDITDYDNSESYTEIARAMDEVEERALKVLDTVSKLLQSMVALVTSLALILNLDLYILLFSIVSLFINMWFSVKYNKVDYDFLMAQTNYDREIEYVHRVLYQKEYAQDVRMTNLSGLLFGMMDKAFGGIRSVYKKMNPKMMAYDALPQAVSMTLTVASIFYIIFQISMGRLSAGSFAALLNGSQSVTATISGLFIFIPQFQQHSLHLDNLFQVFRRREMLVSGERPINGSYFTIEFSHVYFRYPNDEDYVLKDISFRVNNNEAIGIVGHNGAGKSTLIKLLLRLYDPTEGVILLDGIDYREYDLDALRRSMGTVFQNYYTYPFSVRENVAMEAVASEKYPEIDTVLEEVALYQKLKSMDSGMTRPLSNEFENGIILSGGEQQKVAIARVLYGQHPIIVMDEPSSALDPVSEAEMISLIYRQYRKKTMFIISHRLSTTKHCDKIIHLSGGEIIELGSHEQLMKEKGGYSRLFNLQAENYFSDTKNQVDDGSEEKFG